MGLNDDRIMATIIRHAEEAGLIVVKDWWKNGDGAVNDAIGIEMKPLKVVEDLLTVPPVTTHAKVRSLVKAVTETDLHEFAEKCELWGDCPASVKAMAGQLYVRYEPADDSRLAWQVGVMLLQDEGYPAYCENPYAVGWAEQIVKEFNEEFKANIAKAHRLSEKLAGLELVVASEHGLKHIERLKEIREEAEALLRSGQEVDPLRAAQSVAVMD